MLESETEAAQVSAHAPPKAGTEHEILTIEKNGCCSGNKQQKCIVDSEGISSNVPKVLPGEVCDVSLNIVVRVN